MKKDSGARIQDSGVAPGHDWRVGVRSQSDPREGKALPYEETKRRS